MPRNHVKTTPADSGRRGPLVNTLYGTVRPYRHGGSTFTLLQNPTGSRNRTIATLPLGSFDDRHKVKVGKLPV